jgi:hypothetical protein
MIGKVELPAAVRHVHPSGLLQPLDHVADKNRMGPAFKT